jgi:hypothetical protein
MKIALVTCMRNEAAMLPEWIAYHRAIGVTDFVVYTNDCEDGTDAMLERLAAIGGVHHAPNPRQGKKTVQWQALSHGRQHPAVISADWVGSLDVDEFLVIHAGAGRLADLFAWDPEATGFSFAWRMFGATCVPGLETAQGVTARFTRAAPARMLWPWRAVQHKCLWRNDGRYSALGVHRPREPVPEAQAAHLPPEIWVDDRGERRPPPHATSYMHDQPRYGLGQINHYALGTPREFLIKKERGRPNHSHWDIALDYWIERDFNDVEDTSIARFQPEIEAGIAAMMEDKPLADLYRRGQEWRRIRMAQLSDTLEGFDMLQFLEHISPGQSLPLARQRVLLNQFIALRRRKFQEEESQC